MCLRTGVWLSKCICDYIPISLGWLWLFTFKLCVCLCTCVFERVKGSRAVHSVLLNMSSCVSLPVDLCPPVVCRCVWTVQPGVRFLEETASHQQGAPESRAPAFQGPKLRILGG